MQLVAQVYTLTGSYPKNEAFGLVLQIRRAAVSIPSNIAEGAARAGRRELLQFLRIASGSLSELETQLLISASLGYVRENNHVFNQLDRVSYLLMRMITSLRDSRGS
jgi:four helix bundle protein